MVIVCPKRIYSTVKACYEEQDHQAPLVRTKSNKL